MTPSRLASALVVAAWLLPASAAAQHGKEEAAGHSAAAAKTKSEHGADAAAEHDAPKAKATTAAAKDKSAASEHKAGNSRSSDTSGALMAKLEAPAEPEHAGEAEGHGAKTEKPEEKEKEPAAKSSKSSKASSRSKSTSKTELQAAYDRINEQIDAIGKPPAAKPAAAKPVARRPAPVRRVSKPQPGPAVVAAREPEPEPIPRVALSWRASLTWSADLGGEDAVRQNQPRVNLAWDGDRRTTTRTTTSASPTLVSSTR